jgi:excisionase family DNA binding protein
MAGTKNVEPLSVPQAAEHANVSRRQIDYWRERNGLPFLKIGYMVRILSSDLDAFLLKHRVVKK